MQFQFQPGTDHVKAPGISRPCLVLQVRTHDRKFKGRLDSEGTKVELAEPHYTVQLDGSSTTKMFAESKLKLIPPADLEFERSVAPPLPTGTAQSISGAATQQARDRARVKALSEEKKRLVDLLEEKKLADEVDELKAQLAGTNPLRPALEG
jgi:hypothetical protein